MKDRNSNPEEIGAWISDNNFGWFQKGLDLGPQEFRYQVLAALLADEMRGFDMTRLPPFERREILRGCGGQFEQIPWSRVADVLNCLESESRRLLWDRSF